jgi:hypothetical protein
MKIPGAVGAACLQCALPLLLLTGVKGDGPCFLAFMSVGNLLVALPLPWGMGHFNFNSLLKGEMRLPWESAPVLSNKVPLGL